MDDFEKYLLDNGYDPTAAKQMQKDFENYLERERQSAELQAELDRISGMSFEEFCQANGIPGLPDFEDLNFDEFPDGEGEDHLVEEMILHLEKALSLAREYRGQVNSSVHVEKITSPNGKTKTKVWRGETK